MIRRSIILATVCILLALSAVQPAAAHPEGDDAHPLHSHGLGSYGPTGPIERGQLSPELANYVSDEALELAQSDSLVDARNSWNIEIDFVFQVHYQLTFRRQTDYLDTSPDHLGMLLHDRPENSGINGLGLYMTKPEIDEFVRRQELGDRIPLLIASLGEEDNGLDGIREGENVTYGQNYGGVWQDQLDGGVLVVAVVDSKDIDQTALERIAGGKENLKIVEVKHSWDEVNRFRDFIVAELGKAGIEAGVPIHSTGVGRVIEIVTPEAGKIPSDLIDAVPAELLSITEGSPPREAGGPRTTHAESAQTPGLAIELDPGGWCTWGVNGHTSAFNYLVTAGHCGGGTYDDYSGWTSNLNIHQNNSFHLTPGNSYVYSKNTDPWDMKRVSSPQADSNCYQSWNHCASYIKNRALHNSWEINSDSVCGSFGALQNYVCGFVVEENHTSSVSGCEGDRWARFSIDVIPGDSGAGLINGLVAQTSIDIVTACFLSGAFGLGNTAYDVKNQLGFDYNCASSRVTGRAASAWGSCPTINR